MSRFSSLSFKMPITISLMSIIMLAFLLSASVFFSNKGITQSTDTGFKNTVEGYANLFNSILNSQVMVSVAYSSSANIRNYLINRDENYRSLGLMDLNLFIKRNEYLENIYVVDVNGSILLDKKNELTGQSMAEFRPGMWNKLKAGQEYAIGNNMRKSADTGEYTVSIGTQILDFENNIIGYLVLIVRSSIIHKNYFSNIKLGRSGRIVAVNDQLKVVMDTDINEVAKDAPNEYDNIFKSGSLEGNIEYIFNNHKRLGYYKKIRIHTWIVAYAMDEEEIYEINKSIVITSVIIGIISMIFMTLVVFLFTRSIIKPLNIIVELWKTYYA